MKIKKIILALIFISFLGINSFSQTTAENNVFAMGSRLGVVTGNKVQFYEFTGRRWEVNKNFELTLPDGHKGVFSYSNGPEDKRIGVIIDDNVRIYTFNNNENSWKQNFYNFTSVSDLPLPEGYKNVFSTGTDVSVNVNNKIQSYSFFNSPSGWHRVEAKEYELPNGYNDVYVINRQGIGVVINNVLKIYSPDLGMFHHKGFDFTLPRGYKYILSMNFTTVNIGIVTEKKIEFYEFNYVSNRWILNKNLEFKR